ncbi:hypothetical protein BS78_K232100 [Paspalum vaginatum]|uniref:Uncharacterized protein n=1 Tax=Paspalum vaginatum TaxID=158149 RepID=A0A9W7X711_9POAL|nr:hypothetical protein BS78_K232100 [Paspalum vaginatum]
MSSWCVAADGKPRRRMVLLSKNGKLAARSEVQERTHLVKVQCQFTHGNCAARQPDGTLENLDQITRLHPTSLTTSMAVLWQPSARRRTAAVRPGHAIRPCRGGEHCSHCSSVCRQPKDFFRNFGRRWLRWATSAR